MMTRCPRCFATFKLLAEHLRAAHGRVQCGRCDLQFDAVENLIDADGAAGAVPPPAIAVNTDDGEAAAPRLTPVRKTVEAPETTPEEVSSISFDEAEMESGSSRAPVEAAGMEVGDEDMPPEAGEESLPMPVDGDLPFPLEAAPAGSKTSPFWTFLSLVLLALLAGQLAWWQYDEVLTRWPQLRPFIEQACRRLHCTVEARRDLGAIHIISRDISEHPRFQHALLVKLTFVNQAAFVQPYPVMGLVLFDQAGRAIGQRRFLPREYLPAGTVVESGMPPSQSIYAVLELAAPAAEDAVSFEFNFL